MPHAQPLSTVLDQPLPAGKGHGVRARQASLACVASEQQRTVDDVFFCGTRVYPQVRGMDFATYFTLMPVKARAACAGAKEHGAGAPQPFFGGKPC
jgi:hypothetical protein